MYLLPKEEYLKLKSASVSPENNGEGGVTKEQVNHIDVSHGGTLLINSKEADGRLPIPSSLPSRERGDNGSGGGGGGRREGKIIPVPVAPYTAGITQAENVNTAARGEEEGIMRQQEKELMKALVQERLDQLSGNGRKRLNSTVDIASGSDGVGRERDVLHQLKNDISTQTPNGETGRKTLMPVPLRARRKLGNNNSKSAATVVNNNSPLQRTGGPMAAPAPLPLPSVPQPMEAQVVARRIPVLPPRPDRIVSSKFKLPHSRKKKAKDIYAPKPLKKKHPRSWAEPLPTTKKRRHKYPYLGYHVAGEKRLNPGNFYGSPYYEPGEKLNRVGKAGMSGKNKRKLTREDWEEAEDPIESALPPSKRKPAQM